ncbi:hypothetical protein CCACVL1_20252 [Corchorus capsularis]|uniref:Uncharacterized protein n=1 Tax=Corchorus capsularis TaxID=210143 RepID=A0A1R3HBZ8_COCAP|nr:hypothetical protein CCACVL1_20252 [Corchorus capsularis]
MAKRKLERGKRASFIRLYLRVMYA